MAAGKKKGGRRRGNSDSIETGLDDRLGKLKRAMDLAYMRDLECVESKLPAVHKLKRLPSVEAQLSQPEQQLEFYLDNGLLTAIRKWLEPLPDASLPSLDIRRSLLGILQEWKGLGNDPEQLKESGIGRVIMFIHKCPRETEENRATALRLISKSSLHAI